MAYVRISLAFCAAIMVVGGLLWAGGTPERRYEASACQFNMIYDYQPEASFGLLTVGGSRIRYASSTREFDAALQDLKPDALPVHNLAHAYYSLGKEYVLLRDLLEIHQPKAALIMIEPRGARFGTIHPTYVEIARLGDIPRSIYALWPESPLNAITAARDILVEHLKPLDRVKSQSLSGSERNCAEVPDPRLMLPVLTAGFAEYENASKSVLEWDLSAPDQEGFRRWMEAYRALSAQSGVEFIFLLMTATNEPLPAPGLEDAFEDVTGMNLITLTPEIHAVISPDGKRDNLHLNETGRKMFLPYLIRRIDEKCARKDGCF